MYTRYHILQRRGGYYKEYFMPIISSDMRETNKYFILEKECCLTDSQHKDSQNPNLLNNEVGRIVT